MELSTDGLLYAKSGKKYEITCDTKRTSFIEGSSLDKDRDYACNKITSH